jgi:hypothetical protein
MANPVPPSAALGELSRQRSALLHPVSVIALVILIGVFALIAAAVLDWDKGKVLVRLSEREFARGLITYVFAIGTVGIAVVLVVAVLVGGEEMKERFNLGKEVLSLLLGIFGTIVGFYYGSELSAAVAGRTKLALARPLLSADSLAGGDSLTLTSRVEGGSAPYTYSLSTDSATSDVTATVIPASGWIVLNLRTPRVQSDTKFKIRLLLADAAGDSANVDTIIKLSKRPK